MQMVRCSTAAGISIIIPANGAGSSCCLHVCAGIMLRGGHVARPATSAILAVPLHTFHNPPACDLLQQQWRAQQQQQPHLKLH